MKILKLLSGCVMAAATILSCKKEDTTVSNVLNEADINFIRLAGISNHSEIETAKVALAKTADSVVLSFAQQMITDHTNAQSDLKTMGSVVGFTIQDTVDAAHTATIAHLDSLTGRTFDSTYIHTQLADHNETINFYGDELAKGNQLNVRAYANTNLQNIKIHYQRADSIANAYY